MTTVAELEESLSTALENVNRCVTTLQTAQNRVILALNGLGGTDRPLAVQSLQELPQKISSNVLYVVGDQFYYSM